MSELKPWQYVDSRGFASEWYRKPDGGLGIRYVPDGEDATEVLYILDLPDAETARLAFLAHEAEAQERIVPLTEAIRVVHKATGELSFEWLVAEWWQPFEPSRTLDALVAAYALDPRLEVEADEWVEWDVDGWQYHARANGESVEFWSRAFEQWEPVREDVEAAYRKALSIRVKPDTELREAVRELVEAVESAYRWDTQSVYFEEEWPGLVAAAARVKALLDGRE